jgi:hypothetical protein
MEAGNGTEELIPIFKLMVIGKNKEKVTLTNKDIGKKTDTVLNGKEVLIDNNPNRLI